MRHTDLTPSLASTLGKIAEAATTARIVVDSGTSVYHAADGTDTIIGGTTGAVTPFVGDTTAPPVPSVPTVTTQSGAVFITWGGTFADGADQPADFAYVTAYVDGTARGHLTKAGTVAVGDLAGGVTVSVTLTASDDAHDEDGKSTPNESAATDAVTVSVAEAVTKAEVIDIGKTLTDAQQEVHDLQQAQATQQTAITTAQKAAQDAATAAVQASLDASSAVVLRVDSTRGLVFKNSLISTVLSVTVFAKGQTITDITTLRSAVGSSAYLEWQWRRVDDSDFGVISSGDPRISADGFTLTVSPADVDVKTVFMCVLNT